MSKQMLIGLVALLAAAGIIAVVQFVVLSEDDSGAESTDNNTIAAQPTEEPATQSTPPPTPTPHTIEIAGFVGGEKLNFLNNPEVQSILAERYNISVDPVRMGSIEMMTVDSSEMDFLWPSNEVALELYEQQNGNVSNETIFNSPIVMYAWSDITAGLIAGGLVEQIDNTYYVIDMPRLIQMIIERQSWSDVSPDYFGAESDLCISGFPCNSRFEVFSTDPTLSNSGNMFYGLITNLLVQQQSGGEAVVATLDNIQTVLPDIKTYYDTGVSQADSSGTFFDAFVTRGIGQYPIAVGYENQIIEYILEAKNNPRSSLDPQIILDNIDILYPRPTVWSSHPIIALTDNGEILLEALQDEDIQQIAWEQHGFRAGPALGITNDPNIFKIDIGQEFVIPEQILNVLRLPSPETMNCIIEYLNNENTIVCQ